jgi:hypothetical protein
MMKCKEYEDYQGEKVTKKQKTKAETIVDVIFECIYLLKRGVKLD